MSPRTETSLVLLDTVNFISERDKKKIIEFKDSYKVDTLFSAPLSAEKNCLKLSNL